MDRCPRQHPQLQVHSRPLCVQGAAGTTLTYAEVEHADRIINDAAVRALVANLFAAYRTLSIESDARGTLAIQLPEYKVHFDAQGNVDKIAARAALESNRLIEAFMVTANVAAADCLLKARMPGVYRVHEAALRKTSSRNCANSWACLVIHCPRAPSRRRISTACCIKPRPGIQCSDDPYGGAAQPDAGLL